MPVFQVLELDEEFVFTKDMLPTTNDVLKYVLSEKDIIMREFMNRHILLLNSGRKQIAVIILFSELPSCLNKFTITV